MKIYIVKKEAAMNENVLDYTVQYGYTGTVTKYDLTSIWYRSFSLVKKELASKQKFKFYSSVKLWSARDGSFKDDVSQVTSTVMK